MAFVLVSSIAAFSIPQFIGCILRARSNELSLLSTSSHHLYYVTLWQEKRVLHIMRDAYKTTYEDYERDSLQRWHKGQWEFSGNLLHRMGSGEGKGGIGEGATVDR